MTIAVDDATERAMLDAGLAMINGGSGDASGDFIVMSSIESDIHSSDGRNNTSDIFIDFV